MSARIGTVSTALWGTVTDSNGAPVSGVAVNVAGKVAYTSADGTYVIVGIAPAGTYGAIYSKRGYYTKTAKVRIPASGICTQNMTLPRIK
jgi:hypothetical protein